MKLSLNWLNQYVSPPVTAGEAAEILTAVGLEVEGTEIFESIKGGLKGIVIGKVVEKEKHPDADRLSITKVDIGTGELQQIVCGAPNVAEGQTVIVATVGAVLYPVSGEPFEIKKSKIRGVESHGMICAEDEIGIGSSHDGIIVLTEDIAPGTSASSYYAVENDTVLEINITPNRSDAASHIGSARDITAYLNARGKKTKLIRPSVDSFTEGTGDEVTIILPVPEKCPRYTGITISGITVGESPQWLKNRLSAIGLRPINNVVDATNYILHETGHPLHAFDLAKVAGKKVLVDNATEGEKFVTLDGVERTLGSEDLMIKNAEGNMCIGGVFGGAASGVSENTTAIFLESAFFQPATIRKTGKKHHLHTDASFRFERGADINITPYALKRAAQLICEVAGGHISSPVTDVYPLPHIPAEVFLHTDYLAGITGINIPSDIVTNILQSLEFRIISASEEGWRLEVPSSKVDVTREADVSEEILRIYGFEHIPVNGTLKASLSAGSFSQNHSREQELAKLLAANGYFETTTLSFAHSRWLTFEKPEVAEKMIRVKNPISSELDIMRTNLLFNGLEVVAHNINRKNTDLRLFEIGKTYLKSGDKEQDFIEQTHIALFHTGLNQPENWYQAAQKTGFFELKGAVESIVQWLGIACKPVKPAEKHPYFAQAFIVEGYGKNNPVVAEFGQVLPSVLKEFDIKQPVWYASLDRDLLLSLLPKEYKAVKEIPKYPSVRRDLALLLDEKTDYKTIHETIQQSDKKILKDISLFDVYEGKNLPKGKKSYAISLVFRDDQRTLTDHEIDQAIDKITKQLADKTGAELRQ